MATQQEINDYKFTLLSMHSLIGRELSDSLNISGRNELENNIIKFNLLSAYIDIMIDYFEKSDYSTNNFFTTDEANDIMQHINNLMNSNYWINL